MRPMVVRALLAGSVLLLAMGCGRSAPPPAPAVTDAAPAPAPAATAPTLAERLAAAAPEERPTEMAWDKVLPGMPPEEIAKLLGRPDQVKETAHGARLGWLTGSVRDPIFVVWLHQGVAQRMRFIDRW